MIENTADRDPLIHIVGSLAGGLGDYVEEMEAAGQREMVHSDQLPTEIHGAGFSDFESLGFTFGTPNLRDPMFVQATLPVGWQRQPSDHSMWSYIVDRNGRRRVAIFYKAAFYDRQAFMRLETPLGDLSRLLYGEISELPIDEWTTREVWLDLLPAERDRRLKQAADDEQYGYAAGASRNRAEARRIEALREALGGGGSS